MHAINEHGREHPGVFMPAIVTRMTVKGNGPPENPQRTEKKKLYDRRIKSQNLRPETQHLTQAEATHLQR
jgi:hypothetical protein